MGKILTPDEIVCGMHITVLVRLLDEYVRALHPLSI